MLISITAHTWFQASAALYMRSALFWGITRRHVVIVYRRFGTTYRSHLQWPRFRAGKKRKKKDYSNSWPVKIGPTRCPETSVNNYHTTPRNIPEERRSQLLTLSRIRHVLFNLFGNFKDQALGWNSMALYQVSYKPTNWISSNGNNWGHAVRKLISKTNFIFRCESRLINR